jgi:2-hydroxy-3-oxopropionate reductase
MPPRILWTVTPTNGTGYCQPVLPESPPPPAGEGKGEGSNRTPDTPAPLYSRLCLVYTAGYMGNTLGFIGLGEMGGRMCRNLLKDEHTVVAFDTSAERLAVCVEAGATPAGSPASVADAADIVFASLPSAEVFGLVFEQALLPRARPGQVVVDLGTNTAPRARRQAAALAARGATLLDAPVSGGTSGAQAGTLYVFVGGDGDVAQRVWPLLEVIGQPDRVTYCGPSGAGHVAKGVNQLAMGLGAAAYLEAVAFGVLAGVDAEVLARAVGGPDAESGVGGAGGWRAQLAATARRVAAGEGEEVGVKFGQLHYFLEEAAEQGFQLPLSRALHDFCAAGERVMMEANRLSPSFWRELTLAAGGHAGAQAARQAQPAAEARQLVAAQGGTQ